MSDAAVAVESSPRSADERYGWIYGSFWLVFLGFAFYQLVTGDQSPIIKAIGVGLLVVFCAVYISANRHLNRISTAQAWAYLAALTAILVAVIPIFGANALSFAPYLCAWATLSLPPRWSAAVVIAWIVISVVVAWAVEWGLLMYTAIIVGVSASTGAVGVFERSGRRVEEMRLRTQVASDRERIARDVHDVLGHSLTAVVVKSELAQRLVSVDPDAARRELAEIEALSRSALAEIRTTVGGLRAIRLADEVETARGLLASAGVHLDAPNRADEVDPRASVTMAWAVREATTNIVRHSGATQATIRWGRDWIEVTDNGRGVRSRSNGSKPGSGLAGLNERVTAMGGSLVVESGPGGIGTRVRVEQR